MGTNYKAELWGGMSGDTLIPAADIENGQPRLITPFGNGGYFYTSHIATVRSIVPPGGLLGCTSALGTRDWGIVAALDLGGYGESPMFYTQGGNPLGVPSGIPRPLAGLQSFNLQPVVPEPSSLALIALCGALWAAQKSRRKGD